MPNAEEFEAPSRGNEKPPIISGMGELKTATALHQSASINLWAKVSLARKLCASWAKYISEPLETVCRPFPRIREKEPPRF